MRVSVVIPWHRDPDDLGRALASVLSQQGTELEVIVVANGVDDALFAAAGRLTTDSRCRLVRLTTAGASAARNHGMDLATGELIFFLDADDTFLPGKVLAFIAAHLRFPFGAAFSRGLRQRGAGASWPMPAAQWDGQAPIAEFLFCDGNNISTSALVISAKAKTALRFDALASPYEDPDLLIQAEAKGLVMQMLPEVLYVWNDARAANRLSRAVDAGARLHWIDSTPANVSARARAAFRARCVAQHVLRRSPWNSLRLILKAWVSGGVSAKETLMFLVRGLLPVSVASRAVDLYLAGKAAARGG
jgi:glycosyltransferase involved in cell wall biosynthesis